MVVVRFLLATAVFPYAYLVHVMAWSMLGVLLFIFPIGAMGYVCRYLVTRNEEYLDEAKEAISFLYTILLWPFEIWYKIVFLNEYPKNYSS